MSYRVINLPNNWNSFGPREGLEGPFSFNRRVLYYDTKEEQYYDPLTDYYLSNDEFFAIKGE